MPAASRSTNYAKAETDIAVLQVQVNNIESDIGEVKADIKAISENQHKMADESRLMLAEMRADATKAHDGLNKKITALEKWRWMMMGAGIVLGSFGFDLISKLLR